SSTQILGLHVRFAQTWHISCERAKSRRTLFLEMKMNRTSFAACAYFGACVLLASAHAQTPAEFFNNRQMTMIVSTTVGGGYDILGRMFARHMGKYLPKGNAKFVVKNMPGAGGLVATNHMYNVAERDGSTIAVVNREALLEPLLAVDTTQAKFD